MAYDWGFQNDPNYGKRMDALLFRRAMNTAQDAADDEKRWAARFLSRSIVGIDTADGREYNGNVPMDAGTFFDKMHGFAQTYDPTTKKFDLHFLDSENQKAWDKLPDDLETRFAFAREHGNYSTVNNRLGSAAGRLASTMHVTEEERRELAEGDFEPGESMDITSWTPPDMARKLAREIVRNGGYVESSQFQDADEAMSWAQNVESGEYEKQYRAAATRISELKALAEKRKTVREYERQLAEENSWRTVAAVSPALTDAGREILRTAMAHKDDLKNAVGDDFMRLARENPAEAEKVAAVIHALQPDVSGHTVMGDAMRAMRDTFVNTVQGAAESIGHTFERTVVGGDEYQARREREAMYRRAFSERQKDWGWWGDATIGFFGTLPYMGIAAIPYAGTAAIALSAANDFEKQVVDAGGDVSRPDFFAAKFGVGVVYAAIERAQVIHPLRGLTDFGKARMYANMFGSVSDFLKVAAHQGLRLGGEVWEEGLQGALEKGFVAWGMGGDVAAEAARALVQDMHGSIGAFMPLMVIEGAGTHRMYRRGGLTADDTIQATQMLRGFQDKAEITAADAARFGDQYGTMAVTWANAGPDAGRRTKALQARFGLKADDASMADDVLSRLWKSVSATGDEETVREFFAGASLKSAAEMLKETLRDAKVVPNKDGTQTITGFIGESGHEVSFTIGRENLALDVTSEAQALSIVNTLNQLGYEGGMLTPEEWLAKPVEERQDVAAHYGLESQGRTDNRKVSVKTRRVLADGTQEVVEKTLDGKALRILSGDIVLDENTLPQTVFHEAMHGLLQLAEDIAPKELMDALREVYPPLKADETVNEERISDLYRDYLSGKIPAVEYEKDIFDKLAAWIRGLLGMSDASLTIANARTSADVLFNQMLSGDFSGVVEAEKMLDVQLARIKQREAERKAESQRKAESKETETAKAGSKADAGTENLGKEKFGGEIVAAEDEMVDEDGNTIPPEQIRDAIAQGKIVMRREVYEAKKGEIAPNLTDEEKRRAWHLANDDYAGTDEQGRAEVPTPDGEMKVNTQLAVVDRGELITSDDPRFPQDVQNRLGRETSPQVDAIAQAPNPLWLGPAKDTADGAPLVYPWEGGYIVVAGNGRVLGLAKGDDEYKSTDAYNSYAKATGERFGLDIPDTAHPRLVRVITDKLTDEQLNRLGRLSNKSGKRAEGAAGTRKSDGMAVRDNLGLVSPDMGASLRSPENSAFAFAVASDIGENGLLTSDEMGVAQSGYDRVENALLGWIVNHHEQRDAIQRALEEQGTTGHPDLGIGNILNGIKASAIHLAALAGAEGREAYDITPDIADALKDYIDFRQGGGTDMDAFLAQGDMFQNRPSLTEAIMREFFARRNSAKRVQAILDKYAETAMLQDNATPTLLDMGETAREDIWKLAVEKADAAEESQRRDSVTGRATSADTDGATADDIAEAARQYAEVVARYTNPDGTRKPGWMMAPNGKPTNLTERQWVQVRTENFKRWFGDWENDPANASKVVDENGEPMVVWHGTGANFTEFKPGTKGKLGPGIYLTTLREKAERHSHLRGRGYGDEITMPLFANIRNPAFAHYESGRFLPVIDKTGNADGIILGNSAADALEIKAISPSQIKSATDNVGTFSEARPDIRYSVQANPNLLRDVEAALVVRSEDNPDAKPETRRKEIVFSEDIPFFDFLGLPNEKVVSNVVHVRKLAAKHGLTAEQMADLPNRYNAPVAVFRDGGSAFTVITDMLADNDAGQRKPVMVRLTQSVGKNGERMFLASAYAREGEAEDEYRRLANTPGAALFVDENKVAALALEQGTTSTLLSLADRDDVLTASDYSWWSTRNSMPQAGAEGKENLDRRDSVTGARYSIGSIYTGTAADYANRSRQGGKDDGPSLLKIGTGEGAQVYGWGLYGSSVRGVAEGYANSDRAKKNLARVPNDIFVDGKKQLNTMTPEGTAADAFDKAEGDRGKAAAELREHVSRMRGWLDSGKIKGPKIIAMYRRMIARDQSAIRLLEDKSKEFSRTVNSPTPRAVLYEQTFFTDRSTPEETERHLLKWYEPVSEEQLGWIKGTARKEGISLPMLEETLQHIVKDGKDYGAYDNGDDIYDALTQDLGSPKAASEFLARAGIDGVKYPVDSYGTTVKNGDEVGWNYVSFRDDNIRVDHKWVDGQQRYSVTGRATPAENVEAAKTEAQRVLDLIGGTELGNAINRDFKGEGQTTIIGRTVRTAGDLAAAAQIYRNPAFETVRYFFTKNGKVVWQTSITARKPSASPAFVRDAERHNETFGEFNRMVAALHPDGVWMLHNHPSGDVTPSRADIALTAHLAQMHEGAPITFMGHVIIDHDKYAYMAPSMAYGESETKERDFSRNRASYHGAPTANQSLGNPALGSKVARPEDARRIAQAAVEAQKAATIPGAALTLIATDAKNNVRSIATIPTDEMLGLLTEGVLQDYAAATGGSSLLLVGDTDLRNYPQEVQKRLLGMCATGTVLDFIYEKGSDDIGSAFRERLVHLEPPGPTIARRVAESSGPRFSVTSLMAGGDATRELGDAAEPTVEDIARKLEVVLVPDDARHSITAGADLADRTNYEEFKAAMGVEHPLPQGVSLLAENASPQDALAYFERNIRGRTITMPDGEAVTLNIGHFFRLVCDGDHGKKGFVEGYKSAQEALDAIRRGEVAPESINGYHSDRAMMLPVFIDTVGNPAFVLQDKRDPAKIQFVKRFAADDGRGVTAAFRFIGDGHKIQSYHGFSTRYGKIKQNRIVHVGNAVERGASPDATELGKSQQPQNSLPQSGAENKQIPQSAADILPEAPRSSVTGSAPTGKYGRNDYVVAMAAQDRLRGIDRPPRKYAELAEALGATRFKDDDGSAWVRLADELIEKNRDKLARLAERDIREAVRETARMKAEADFSEHVKKLFTGSARFGEEIGSAGTSAWLKIMRDLAARAPGYDLDAMRRDTGADLLLTLMEIMPEKFAPSEDEGKAKGEGEARGEEGEAGQDGEFVGPPTPQTWEEWQRNAEERRKHYNAVILLAKEWIKKRQAEIQARENARAKREAEEEARRKAEAEGSENAGADAESGTDEEGAEPEEDVGPLAIPREVIEAAGVDLQSADEFAAFMRAWICDWLVRQNPGTTYADVLDDEARLATYRRTMIAQLRDIADALLDPTEGKASIFAERMIADIRENASANELERRTSDILGFIQRNAIRQKRKGLIADLLKLIEAQAIRGRKFDALERDMKRKIRGDHEQYCRYIARVIQMSDNAVAKETKALMQIIEGRKADYEQAAAEYGVELNFQSDVEIHRAYEKLAALQQFGGLKNKMPSYIVAASKRLEEWLGNERMEHERRWGEFQAVCDDVAQAIEAGVKARRDKYAKKEPGLGGRMWQDVEASVRQRLEEMLVGAGPERVEAIAKVMRVLSEGSQTLEVKKMEYRRQFEKMMKTAVEGSDLDVKGLLNLLDEEIPEELNDLLDADLYDADGQLVHERQRVRMTWGQAIQLYSSLLQTATYGANIALHGRQDHARAIEEAAHPALIRLAGLMRGIYQERREELSGVVAQVTGLGIFNPDPMYMPAKMNTGVREGLDQKAYAWSPLAKSLTPRVKNRLDFDLTVSVMDVFRQRSDESARAIAFGVRGMALRSMLARKSVVEAMARTHGTLPTRRLIEQVTDTLTGGYTLDEARGGIMGLVQSAGTFTTYASLSFNLVTALKQMQSVASWAPLLQGGYLELGRHLVHFDMDAARELCQAPGFVARYGETSFGRMLQAALADKGGSLVSRLARAGMTLIQIGDFVPGVLVGTGVYKARVAALLRQHPNADVAAVKEQAATETWALVEECQQTSRLEDTPHMLRRWGVMGKQVTKFATAPIQQVAHEIHTLRMWYEADRLGDKETAREYRRKCINTAIANHVILPAAFYAVATLFGMALGDEPPEEDELFGDLLLQMLVGPFARVFFAGTIINHFVGKLDKSLGFKPKLYDESSFPAQDTIIRLIDKGFLTASDIANADAVTVANDLLDEIGIVNSPTRYVAKGVRNYIGFDVKKHRREAIAARQKSRGSPVGGGE